MKLIVILLTISILPLSKVSSQLSCEELTEIIIDKGDHITTDYSYGDDAINKVKFYSLEVDYEDLYFALVTFQTNIYKQYTYQITREAMNDYRYTYGEDEADKFWKYIQPYNKVLDCSPYERKANKYQPRY